MILPSPERTRMLPSLLLVVLIVVVAGLVLAVWSL
jgi:hypothetical protein